MGLLNWLQRRRQPDPQDAFAALGGTEEPDLATGSDEDIARRLFGGLAAAMVARRPHLTGPKGRRVHGPVDRPADDAAHEQLEELLCDPQAGAQPALRDLRRLYRDVGAIVSRVWQADQDHLITRISELATADRESATNPVLVSGLEQLTDSEVVETELELAERIFRRLETDPR